MYKSIYSIKDIYIVIYYIYICIYMYINSNFLHFRKTLQEYSFVICSYMQNFTLSFIETVKTSIYNTEVTPKHTITISTIHYFQKSIFSRTRRSSNLRYLFLLFMELILFYVFQQ